MGYECARGTREGTNIRYGTLFYLCRLLYLPTSSYHLQDSSIAISSSLHFLFSAATLVFKRDLLSFFLSFFAALSFYCILFRFFLHANREGRRKCPPFHLSKSLKSIVTPFPFSSPPYGEHSLLLLLPFHRVFSSSVLERTQSKMKR